MAQIKTKRTIAKMNQDQYKMSFSKDSKFILGLHSSTDELGVGLIHITDKEESVKSSIFPLGKKLSSDLFKCVEHILPSKFWSQIVRIGVATGPGGYTGTRITIIFARTISQQINCQVDGISSFELMIPRLLNSLDADDIKKPFWITKLLKRQGLIGGKYKIINQNIRNQQLKTEEIIRPQIIPSNTKIEKNLMATDNIKQDIIRLLEISLIHHKQNKLNRWDNILPIYPTSPVKSSK